MQMSRMLSDPDMPDDVRKVLLSMFKIQAAELFAQMSPQALRRIAVAGGEPLTEEVLRSTLIKLWELGYFEIAFDEKNDCLGLVPCCQPGDSEAEPPIWPVLQ
jgi:hypothetical protein